MTTKKLMEMPDSQQPKYTESGVHSWGVLQSCGIHPPMAGLTLVLDTMVFSADVATAGTILPLSCAVGAVLGLITYLAQMRFYGDDKQAALVKGLILGLLTAIPVPLSAVLSVPCGIAGFIHNLRRKGEIRG